MPYFDFCYFCFHTYPYNFGNNVKQSDSLSDFYRIALTHWAASFTMRIFALSDFSRIWRQFVGFVKAFAAHFRFVVFSAPAHERAGKIKAQSDRVRMIKKLLAF